MSSAVNSTRDKWLLSNHEMRLLEGLRMQTRHHFGGKVRGERLVAKKGVSIEFADYREYSDGDDLRHLDWNVLARLGTPVIKTYQDEEDLAVYVVLDASASMDFGEPTKYEVAQKIAASLGLVALTSGDALLPRILGLQPSATQRGRAAFVRFQSSIQSARPVQTSGLAAGLRSLAVSSGRLGLVWVVSDGLDPDAGHALRQLAARGHEVRLIQVLSPLDIDPDLEGDLRLIDSESEVATEVTANGPTLAEYRKRFASHQTGLSATMRRIGGMYQVFRTDQPWLPPLVRLIQTSGVES